MIDFFLFVLLSSPLFYAALSRTNLANGSSTMDPTPSLSLSLSVFARTRVFLFRWKNQHIGQSFFHDSFSSFLQEKQ